MPDKYRYPGRYPLKVTHPVTDFPERIRGSAMRR